VARERDVTLKTVHRMNEAEFRRHEELRVARDAAETADRGLISS
jgi:hypothetical protein